MQSASVLLGSTGGAMLSDAHWAASAPLVEVYRPKGKTPRRDPRRTRGALCTGVRRLAALAP